MRRSIRLSLFTMLFVLFLCPSALFAQSGSFVVRPAKIELSGKPGETLQAAITLGNQLGANAAFKISFEDITGGQGPDDPVTLLGTEPGPYSLKEFLRAPSTVTLASGEERLVRVSVAIPKTASPGGLYGSVIFTPVRGQSAGNIIPDSRIGVLIFIRVQGEANESGALSLFDTFNSQRLWFGKPTEAEPLRAQIVFDNTGGVNLNPYGRLVVDAIGSDAAEMQVDPWYVLPESTRMRELEFSKELHYGPNSLSLELNRGYKDVVDEEKITVWIFPPVFATAAGFLLLIALVWWVVRKGKRLHVL